MYSLKCPIPHFVLSCAGPHTRQPQLDIRANDRGSCRTPRKAPNPTAWIRVQGRERTAHFQTSVSKGGKESGEGSAGFNELPPCGGGPLRRHDCFVPASRAKEPRATAARQCAANRAPAERQRRSKVPAAVAACHLFPTTSSGTEVSPRNDRLPPSPAAAPATAGRYPLSAETRDPTAR